MTSQNETNTFRDVIARLVKERERLNLTQAQFACLAGVACEDQAALEAGKWDCFPMDYLQGAQHVGADPMFILGRQTEPKTLPGPQLAFGSPIFRDDAFLEAVDLLRKSVQAVNAFAGDKAAEKCPQLVVALMQTALKARYACGPGHLEDFADKLSGAISDMGEAIATALHPDD